MSEYSSKRKNDKPKLNKLRLLILIFLLGIMIGSCSSQIKIADSAKNVTIRYTYKMKFNSSSAMLVYLTEREIFSNSDMVFSGRIKDIRNIEINCDGHSTYRSLIKIKTDEFYKGGHADSMITIMSSPIGLIHAEDEDMLYTLKEGQFGIFMAQTVVDHEYFFDGGCVFDASEICDARFNDGVRFGFIKKINGEARCCDTLANSEWHAFPSLTEYDWDSVVCYVNSFVGN